MERKTHKSSEVVYVTVQGTEHLHQQCRDVLYLKELVEDYLVDGYHPHVLNTFAVRASSEWLAVCKLKCPRDEYVKQYAYRETVELETVEV